MTLKACLITLSFLCGLSPFFTCDAGMQVGGIAVNVKSDSGLKARELAIAEARRKAFLEITQGNSAFEYDLKSRGMPSDEALENAVDTFEIEKEKISPKQYIGTLSITFSDRGLRRLLQGRHDRDSDDQSAENNADQTQEGKSKDDSPTNAKDVILVPVYLTSDESLMWDTKNPWHQFWQQAPQEDVLKTRVPLGDVQDIMSISIEDIMTNRAQRIQGLLDRYGKDALVVAILKRVSLEHNELELTVKLFHSDRLVFSSDPLFVEADTPEEAFTKARIELIKALQDQSSSAIQTKNVGLQTYHVTASFNSFGQWQQIRRGLKIGAVQVFSVASLSRTYAKIVIKSSLPFHELVGELARRGLVFSEGTPGSFDLSVGLRQSPPSKPLDSAMSSPSHFKSPSPKEPETPPGFEIYP
ncbi:MAG TPA: hypothetical protein DD412_02160 [Holosporales bacterium]|nr:hypothetical protein [Holosporales bacterium]